MMKSMIFVAIELWCVFHSLHSCFPIWNPSYNIPVSLLQIHKKKDSQNYGELNSLRCLPTSDALDYITRNEVELGKERERKGRGERVGNSSVLMESNKKNYFSCSWIEWM